MDTTFTDHNNGCHLSSSSPRKRTTQTVQIAQNMNDFTTGGTIRKKCRNCLCSCIAIQKNLIYYLYTEPQQTNIKSLDDIFIYLSSYLTKNRLLGSPIHSFHITISTTYNTCKLHK